MKRSAIVTNRQNATSAVQKQQRPGRSACAERQDVHVREARTSNLALAEPPSEEPTWNLLARLACWCVLGSQFVLPLGLAAPAREAVQSQAIIYSRQGFHPAQITRPAGKVVLFIENRSDNKTPKFQLFVENGPKVQEKQALASKVSLAQVLDLTPGTYVLTEASRTSVSCRIVVTAK